jgi:hypothetical protein
VTYNNNRASASTFMTNAMHTHIFWEHPVFTLEPIELSQGCWEDSASTHYQADKVERLGIICSTYNPRFVHLQVIRRVRFQQQATHHNFSPCNLPYPVVSPQHSSPFLIIPLIALLALNFQSFATSSPAPIPSVLSIGPNDS